MEKGKWTNIKAVEKEVKSIFFDRDYFGLVYGSKDAENHHKLEVYDMKMKLRLEKEYTMSYQNIEFLENHEICIRNEYECEIYTLRGTKKFAYKFDDALYKIFSDGRGRRYTFVLDGVIEKVRLK